jgi:hypothetical protein
MMRFSRLVSSAACLLAATATFAQQNSLFEETMFRSGKINVVVAVVTVILAGLGTWLFLLDRRVKRMEDRTKTGK